jgi:hypothetical protein
MTILELITDIAHSKRRETKMQLVARQIIQAIAFKYEAGDPIEISLGGGSVLTLTVAACEKYGISIINAHALVGKELICVLDSQDFPEEHNVVVSGLRVIRPPAADHLAIASLTKKEIARFIWSWGDPTYISRETAREIRLATIRRPIGRGGHLPRPLYEFTIELSASQYKLCRQLPANAGFMIRSIKIT